MGKLLAVALALILVCNGQRIFRENVPIEAGSWFSFYTFMATIFLLLYDLRLYPSSLRKLDGFGQTFIEFLVAAFLMENILMDFWIPLITTISQEMLPDFAHFVDETLKQRDWNCYEFCDFLKSETFANIVSSLLSVFFFVAVLHAIRAIDLRALQDGPSCFFGDIFHRGKRFFRKKLRWLGFGGRKRVKIRETAENRKSSKRNKIDQDPTYDKNKDPCLEVDNDPVNDYDEYDKGDYENDDQYQMDNTDSGEEFSEFDMASDLYCDDQERNYS